MFLPYLSGERTPHNDASIRGGFAGLGHESDRVALTRAVIEGVAFAFRDSLEALAQAGTRLERVTAIGGGSRSIYWLEGACHGPWPARRHSRKRRIRRSFRCRPARPDRGRECGPAFSLHAAGDAKKHQSKQRAR
jgi:hypothetical protein